MGSSDDKVAPSGISYTETDVSEISSRDLNNAGFKERYQKQKDILFRFVLRFTIIWSSLVVFLLYAKSFNWFGCSLSDCVLCTLLTTTFGTVIGLPLIASKHFFPNKKTKK